MKNLLLLLSIFLSISLTFSACNTGEKQSGEAEDTAVEEVEGQQPDPIVLEKDGIVLTEVFSPVFDEAVLNVVTPANGSQVDPGSVDFSFDVANYELAIQTDDADTKSCANSAKGQHIHLILNNEPYSAHYEASFTREIEEGHYTALAFLSRSYHESVKSPGAFQLFSFDAGEADDSQSIDAASPHMFYSRPKGTYEGDDIEKVLLDFYLVNTVLSADGYKVKAVINGVEFMLDKWVPYAMEGLPAGETSIELTLLNPDGKVVQSPFNPVVRNVLLVE